MHIDAHAITYTLLALKFRYHLQNFAIVFNFLRLDAYLGKCPNLLLHLCIVKSKRLKIVINKN